MSTPTSLLAAGLGWAAGMRSMTPPAVLARTLVSQRPSIPLLARRRRQPARVLGTDRAATLLTVAAAGELTADKLPVAPPRTSPPALFGRLASGALAGATVAAIRRQNPVLPALVGAASAVASSFVMMDLRKRVGEALDVPDPAVAVVEDVLAVAISVAASHSATG
ncbi:hypothetical protein B1759_09245 [Rubrivirga sp. SAORIC476]|uniref:DUF4126 family protein n=1 Tax=Rubrivirga sp. SAORIC476 TaxID=1961794 RepID=UPI000BA99E16|nr:DUF4126 family protein [Rubrivirga sp. SAORIC476]PAP81493.1 hypothetical protein B1759_09245 [Rubrivirga sp. SAORIC476]